MAGISAMSWINRGMKHWGVGVAMLLALCGPALAAWDPSQPSTFGNKGQWIEHASYQILNNFQRIDAFMWFDQYKPWMGEPNWKVNSSPGSVNAYKNSWGTLEQGVYLEGFPPDTTQIDAFETLVNHHQARVGWYESLSSPFPTTAVNDLLNRSPSTKPFIVWEPFDASFPGETARNGPSRLQNILDGDYDTRIAEWATTAKTINGQIEISFGHEMNGNWFTWGYLNDDYSKPADENTPGHNGNTANMYKQAFRYVVDQFDALGVTNVDWVWSINADWEDNYSMAFPDIAGGKTYADRMGMNGFNWGRRPRPTNPAQWQWDDWRDFEWIFGPWYPGGVSNYDTLTSLSEAPIMISEFASAPEPGTLVLLAVGGLALFRRKRR